MGRNQYDCPPIESVEEGIRKYWRQGLNDKQIVESLKLAKYFDTTRYSLGIKKFRAMRESIGLFRVRKANLEVDDICDVMVQLRSIYPRAGMREMKGHLFHEHNLSVSRQVITTYFVTYELELVRQRRSHRFRRKRFWSAGVMDIICCDQHDKWKYKYGLALHTGVDPFVGETKWLKVWWTNSDPRLILSYYLEDVEETGFMPLVTQSDPGSENFGIAKGHTFLRQWHDPAMEGYLAHRWMRERKNIPPEIKWSVMRRCFTPGFEDILDIGVNNGWYDRKIPLENLVFRWIFIPWLQKELDAYKDRTNNTAKRRDKNKILPHGVPKHITEFPELYGALDFKIAVEPETIEEVRRLYAPRDHHVFQLVPDTFNDIAMQGYQSLGEPDIRRDNVWDIYMGLLMYIRQRLQDEENMEIQDEWACEMNLFTEDDQGAEFAPDSNLAPLLDAERGDGSFYAGGVNRGAGIDDEQSAQLDKLLNEDEPSVGDEPEAMNLMAPFSEDEDDSESEGDGW